MTYLAPHRVRVSKREVLKENVGAVEKGSVPYTRETVVAVPKGTLGIGMKKKKKTMITSTSRRNRATMWQHYGRAKENATMTLTYVKLSIMNVNKVYERPFRLCQRSQKGW